MTRKGFTLMEVLIATAIAGMVISAGFRLIAMSYKLLWELRAERELISASQDIWLRFRTNKDTPSNGTDDEKGIHWETKDVTLPVDDYELKYRRVTITIASGRSTVIYVAE